METIIFEAIVAIFLFIQWYSNRKKSDPNSLISSNNFNSQLYPHQTEILHYAGADRHAIFQFHNGDYFYSGHHIQRVTCTNEVSTGRVTNLKSNFQEVIVDENFHYILKHVIENGCFYKNYSDVENEQLKIFMEIYNIRSMFVLGIENEKDQVVAIKMLTFSEENALTPIQRATIIERKKYVENLFKERKKKKWYQV